VKIENFISSGIIEAYVLDQLSEQDRHEVQQMAREHQEVRIAILEAEETLLVFAQKGSIEPPKTAKSDLFNNLNIDLNNLNQVTEQHNIDHKMQQPSANVKKGVRSFYPALSAAASIIAILGIVLTIYYRNQWLQSEDRLSSLYAQNEMLAQQYNIVKNQADQYANNLEVLRQPGIENVQMSGLETAPNAQAMVHWNKNTNQVYLNAKKMPSNDLKNQYQLWAIVDGNPVDMGVFDVSGDMTTLLEMKKIEKASAFAVTLEPRGGSENPSLDKMYVMGQI
jgi:anti-sigma-K factor RskA